MAECPTRPLSLFSPIYFDFSVYEILNVLSILLDSFEIDIFQSGI